MKFSRSIAIKINYIINGLLPPFIRDSKWLFALPMKILFKKRGHLYLNFRERAYSLNADEFKQVYSQTSDINLLQDTDLNKQCIERIRNELSGTNILEVGCGRGNLLKILSKNQNLNLTGTDLIANEELKTHEKIKFIEASTDKLPFSDNEFDTVICTHVLEHVLDIDRAVHEIRRVTKHKIIIVLPKEREYKFGFNLHLTFFPYKFSVMNIIAKNGDKEKIACELVNGDWYYTEYLSV